MVFARHAVASLLVLCCCALPAPVLEAQQFGKEIRVDGVAEQDLYLAGRRVEMLAAAQGDVVAAAQDVFVENQVTGDVLAAGARVDVSARILDDARLAGGEVIVHSRISGDLLAAGGEVRVTEAAQVEGRAWLGGGEVSVAGHVGSELRAAGGDVTISGSVNGDVLIYADSLQILPTAHIAGDLDYYSSRPAEIAGQAVIGGTVTHFPIEEHEVETSHSVGFGILLTLLVTGIVLYLLFPRFSVETITILGTRPGASLGLGLAMVFATPPVILVTMMTMIGIVLAMLLMGLYLLLLLAGFLTGMLYVGNIALRLSRRREEPGRGRRVASLAVAFVILWVLGFLPVVDALLVILATLTGVGALTLRLHRGYRDGLR